MGARTILMAGLSLALVSLAAPSTSVKADLSLGPHGGIAFAMPMPGASGGPATIVTVPPRVAEAQIPKAIGLSAPAPTAASAKDFARVSKRIPAGCDRLVSSLVKSTASLMVGRCVT